MRDCYNQIRHILGDDTEPFESVSLVEEYRQYWKPDKVRVILLAESHVFTSDLDRTISLPQLANLPQYPTNYARFVYCIACGEKQLTGNQLHPKGDGTPPFWKIFHSCNHHVTHTNDFRPILKKFTPYEQRLKNKIDLLKSLKRKGIWLVDSSIVALYHNGKKPANKIMSSVIEKSWECYTGGVIEKADPEHIICIGRGVANILEKNIRKLVGNRYTVIAQPNARLSSEEHMANYRLYSQICCNGSALASHE